LFVCFHQCIPRLDFHQCSRANMEVGARAEIFSSICEVI
jgi:hypothetical protein